MFSATIPKNIEKLAKSLLKDHIRIIVGLQQNKNKNLKSSLSNSIPSIPVRLSFRGKINLKKTIIFAPRYYKPPIVIFVESKLGADRNAM